MASLWATEFLGTGNKGLNGGISDYPAVPPIATQVIADIATSAAVANAFSSACDKVAISSDSNCHIKFGTAPVATTSDLRLQAGVVYMFTIADKDCKVAAIVAAA